MFRKLYVCIVNHMCIFFGIWPSLLKLIIVSNNYCNEPVSSPAESVPMIGVWNREFTLPIHLKTSPSEAMA